MGRIVDNEGKLVTLQILGSTTKADRQRFPLKHFPFYFHVPPKDINWTQGANKSSRKVLGSGTVAAHGGPDLDGVSWDGFFIKKAWYRDSATAGGFGTGLDDYPSFVMSPPSGAYGFYGANESLFILKSLFKGGIVVQLTMVDQNTGEVDINYPAVIESLEYDEEGGEPDARNYNIEFKQHRFLQIRKVPRAGKVPSSGGKSRPSNGRFLPSPFKTPKAGIGIKQIALKAYHDKSKWKIIRDANGGDAGMRKLKASKRLGHKHGPYIFRKGTKLRLPPIKRKK